MAESDRKRRDEELDKFWEIDDLIPRRQAPRYAADTEAVEITIAPPTRAPQKTISYGSQSIPPADPEPPKRHFIPPHTADEFEKRPTPEYEYAPENALIRSVRIYPHKSKYAYYEDFVRNATRLYRVVGVECPRVPFFSYVPQYTQMSREQLLWYLWWRENVRHGRFPDTDYSYVLLYVFELINLATPENAKATQERLFLIWKHYHKIFRQLDTHLPEWICDLSLIHRLTPPENCHGSDLTEIMAHCTLKEFYLPTGGEDVYVNALLTFCSNYDYRKSKFYAEGRIELFDRAIRGALGTIIRHTEENGRLFSSAGMDDSKITRDAFGGALCASRIKRRIEVDFCSFSSAHELRYLITDALKYTENKLRAHFGIRSRLSVYSLPDTIRQLLDAYLEDLLPVRAKEASAKQSVPAEYEHLYDLPKKELSLADAARIEAVSWETTERLVEAFEDGDARKEELIPIISIEEKVSSEEDVWESYRPLLCAIGEADIAAQKALARTAEKPLDVLADEINALAADLLGDVLIEECDGGYAVIEDYRDVLSDLIREHGKES